MRRLVALLSHDAFLTAAGLLLLAATFWLLTDHQRSVAQASLAAHARADRLVVALLDRETSLHGFEVTGDRALLARFERGRRSFDVAHDELRGLLDEDDSPAIAALDAVVSGAQAWERAADEAIARPGSASPSPTETALLDRARLLEDVQDAHARLVSQLEVEADRAIADSRTLTLGILVAIASLYAAVAILVARRRNRSDDARRDARREFGSALLAAASEDEVSSLLVRRVTRAVPAVRTVVALRRNASDDRLVSQSRVEAGPLAEALRDADPESCLAIRLGKVHTESPSEEPLLSCSLCQATAGHTACVPSLVGGEVRGSLLTSSSRPLTQPEREEIERAVEQVAPVLKGLRTLAIAELRARTDVLTGLPNRRDAVATLHRMVAQAIRAASPLSGVMVDLDHFKRLNDEHGHEAGDAALAAVSDAIQARLRQSDFAARWGGEEFLVLLPDTNREGGAWLAEEIRQTIAETAVAGRELRVTASFGVAELPLDAIDAESLVREADRALYAAKQAGRNRVVTAQPTDAAVGLAEVEI